MRPLVARGQFGLDGVEAHLEMPVLFMLAMFSEV